MHASIWPLPYKIIHGTSSFLDTSPETSARLYPHSLFSLANLNSLLDNDIPLRRECCWLCLNTPFLALFSSKYFRQYSSAGASITSFHYIDFCLQVVVHPVLTWIILPETCRDVPISPMGMLWLLVARTLMGKNLRSPVPSQHGDNQICSFSPTNLQLGHWKYCLLDRSY